MNEKFLATAEAIRENKRTKYTPRRNALRSAFLWGALFFISTGCDFQYLKTNTDGRPVQGEGEARTAEGDRGTRTVGQGTISFAKVTTEIFRPKCMTCHAKREPILTDYASIVRVLPQIERAVLIEQTMPRRGRVAEPLSADLQALLREWIEKGAPEFVEERAVDEPAPTPDPVPPAVDNGSQSLARPVGFSALKKTFLDPYCTTCHYKDNEDGLLALDTHAAVVALKDKVELYAIGAAGNRSVPPEDRMPPARFDQPGPEAKAVLLLWLADGMKD
jgi:hypothetical protein